VKRRITRDSPLPATSGIPDSSFFRISYINLFGSDLQRSVYPAEFDRPLDGGLDKLALPFFPGLHLKKRFREHILQLLPDDLEDQLLTEQSEIRADLCRADARAGTVLSGVEI